MILPRLVILVLSTAAMASSYVVPNRPMAFATLTTTRSTAASRTSSSGTYTSSSQHMTADSLAASGDAAIPEPTLTTFREAEVLGLRLMQEGNYQEALNGK